MYKNKIKFARRALLLSQSELAEKVGISRQTLNSIENYNSIPNVKIALLLSKELGCSINELFLLSDEI